MDALKTQIGGGHYKDMKIQPIEFIKANNLDFCQGSIIKYICRFRNKNGREDLEKIIHYAKILIESEYPEKKEPKLISTYKKGQLIVKVQKNASHDFSYLIGKVGVINETIGSEISIKSKLNVVFNDRELRIPAEYLEVIGTT